MIVLDGARMDSRAGLHAELKEKLSLPDYYGNNLDALNDCLGERVERELIVIENAGDFLEADEAYGARVLRVFGDNGIQVLLD
ncbi:MAG: barstar family protein [Clostridia bacterium]|nr:barstar family protein [Clostridia bacterium]